jgi:hypothetical protein
VLLPFKHMYWFNIHIHNKHDETSGKTDVVARLIVDVVLIPQHGNN